MRSLSRLYKAGYINSSNQAKLIETKPLPVIEDKIDGNVDDDISTTDVPIDIPQEILDMIEDAKFQAKQIIETAENQANLIRIESENKKTQMQQQMEAESVKLYNEAQKLGYNEGYNNGYLQGKEEIDQTYAQKIVEINETLNEAREQRIYELVESQDLIIKLSFEIARKVVNNNPKLLSEQIVELAKRSLEKIRDSEKVEIHINQIDFNGVNEALPIFKKILQGKSDIIIQIEQHIDPGSCEIITRMGMIDAKISTQFDEIKKALQTIDLGSESFDET